jgi:hypothetical protein
MSIPEDSQDALKKFLDAWPPDFIGVLTAPFQMSLVAFQKLVRQWRFESAKLHRNCKCPSRPNRRIAFILALEYGPNGGRLHGHILVWNALGISAEQLGRLWRQISPVRLKSTEPLLEPYRPDAHGIAYVLKTFHTDRDLVSFSPGFARVITGLNR